MSFLAIDIGNTNITLGVFAGTTLRLTARLATQREHTEDQIAADIRNVLSLHGESAADVDSCAISSVVPSLGSTVCRAVTLLCGKEPLLLGPGVKTGLNIKIDNPAQLGADLAAGAVGALAKYPMPCVIVDMGTASTISVLDQNGCFLGGAIAAGVRLTLKAMCENTSLLPGVHVEAPKQAIGRNTVDSMKSGLVYGTAAMLDGLIDRMEDELGASATVVATGGLSGEIVRHCRRKDIVLDENLLLEGLRLIYDKNR